jgi:hypothetical protein
MQQMKNLLKNRAVLTILAVVMAWSSLTFALAPKANACPPQQIEYTYYTDATYTVACGYKIIPCYCGETYSDGCRTAYYTIDYYPCD